MLVNKPSKNNEKKIFFQAKLDNPCKFFFLKKLDNPSKK
jgi:hypothetical protein